MGGLGEDGEGEGLLIVVVSWGDGAGLNGSSLGTRRGTTTSCCALMSAFTFSLSLLLSASSLSLSLSLCCCLSIIVSLSFSLCCLCIISLSRASMEDMLRSCASSLQGEGLLLTALLLCREEEESTEEGGTTTRRS